MPQDANDLTAPQPLGRPVNRAGPPEPPEGRWVPVPGAGPYIERNTVTGRWRNVRPPPPPEAPRYPWFGIP